MHPSLPALGRFFPVSVSAGFRLARHAACGAALFVLGISVMAQASGEAIEVKLGQTIPRTWAQVKADNYAYGPKQAYDTATGETQVWLPYGKSGPYYEVSGVKFTDAAKDKGGLPMLIVSDATRGGHLTLKLSFDAPISAFRFNMSLCEWGVKDATVGGVEYSTDGQTWTTIHEVNKPGIINTFVDSNEFKAEGLNTSDLYLRVYSRHKDGGSGGSYWMKCWMAGDPNWGDAASTFFKRQMQVWATPAK